MKDVVFKRGAVSCANGIVSNAGVEILRKGGNAFDAAVAAALAECVVAPGSVGIGGYGGAAVVRSARDNEIVALDFDGCAPLAATPDMFGGDMAKAERGYLAVMAPPIIAGLTALLRNYGTMSFSDVAEPAHRLAEEGFPAYPALCNFKLFLEQADQDSVRAMLPNGVPKEGELFVQKDLAALIGRLREDGPESFYSGDIPRHIASAVRKHGGILDEADFAVVKPRFGKPLVVRSGGCDVYTPEPPSGGLTALEILNSMNAADVPEPGSTDFYRLLIDVARHAWAERLAFLADPDFADVPCSELLSDSHAQEIRSRVAAGVPADFANPPRPGGGHTIHLVAADSEGNAVSLTETHGLWLGSFVVIPGMGLVLGDGMSRFDLNPGHPNAIAPGKRVLHNMCPLLIAKGGRPQTIIGLPGGRKIVNVAAVLAHAITRQGMTAGKAIEQPRFHVEGSEPALVNSEGLTAQMKSAFGSHYPIEHAAAIGGVVAGITIDESTGELLAASDNGPAAVVGL